MLRMSNLLRHIFTNICSITEAFYIFTLQRTLRKKCPYSELFWSVFSRIQIEYREILRISLYSLQMRENTDRNNSEFGHF